MEEKAEHEKRCRLQMRSYREQRVGYLYAVHYTLCTQVIMKITKRFLCVHHAFP